MNVGHTWEERRVKESIVMMEQFHVGFSMGKGTSFSSWKSITTSIDLIVFYLDGLDL